MDPVWCFILCCAISAGLAQDVAAPSGDASCYGSGSMAAAVILTFLVTLGLVAALNYWWTKRQAKKKELFHLILETDPEKGAKADYAFDNPGFKDTTVIPTSEKPSKLENKTKWTHWSPLSALTSKSEKKRALDDSAIESHEVKVVALKSHDFTGLGFSICGNMKEGIYIKDVLHRGPAFESGKLSVGDRINSVTISFEHMVYEDALTILSYASPYEVMIEAKSGKLGSSFQGQAGSPNHPMYRSSSCTDLYYADKSSKKKLFGDDYSSGSNYSSLQKSKSNVTTLERKESPKPNAVKPRKVSVPEALKTHLEEVGIQKSDAGSGPSPKMKEQNDNNTNIEKNVEEAPRRNIDEVDGGNQQPPQPKKREKKSPEPVFERNDSNIKRDKNGIPQEIPDYMLGAAVAARKNRKSTTETPEGGKKTKGKAPSPPNPTSEGKAPKYNSDSDEEAENLSSVNTIELNSSDITIHQTEEEERKSRKTASTGDLFKLRQKPKSNSGTLERAQSLDIADASGTNLVKKRIYDEMEDLLIDKEPRLSLMLDGLNTFQRNRLKKSTEWGHLEDAILNVENGEVEHRRQSEPQFNAVMDRINQIKQESEEVAIPNEAVDKYQQNGDESSPTVKNMIWPTDIEIQEVRVFDVTAKTSKGLFPFKKPPNQEEESSYKKRQQVPSSEPTAKPEDHTDYSPPQHQDRFSVKNRASFFESAATNEEEDKAKPAMKKWQTTDVSAPEDEAETSPPHSLTLMEEVMDSLNRQPKMENIPDETKCSSDTKVATENFLLTEKAQYEHDTNVSDDIKVSRHSSEVTEVKLDDSVTVGHVTVTENGGSNLHSLELSINEPSELYVTALTKTITDSEPELVAPKDEVEVIKTQFSKVTEEGDDFEVEITESKYTILESPTINKFDETEDEQDEDPSSKRTYITEIQVLTPSSTSEVAVVPNGDNLDTAFEDYVKNIESKLDTFESDVNHFENNLDEFIKEEPKSIIIEEKADIEKQVHKIQEIAEEQLKRLPEMRFTTSSYETGRKTPEKRHSFELLRSNFEKSPPRKDSATPPKSRIPIATATKTPPTSPERRDSKNLENENDKALLELMSSSVHSTPFASKIKPPGVSSKNITVTSIRNNSKIPSGLGGAAGRPPLPPRKAEGGENVLQLSTNGSADSSFKQWVFNPNSNVTNVIVGKEK